MKKIMFKQEIPARPSLDSGVSPRQATLEAPMLPANRRRWPGRRFARGECDRAVDFVRVIGNVAFQ